MGGGGVVDRLGGQARKTADKFGAQRKTLREETFPVETYPRFTLHSNMALAVSSFQTVYPGDLCLETYSKTLRPYC
jgi:hypothetical protein